jgi:hypothetical protein
VSIIKSIPNLISYLHEFFWNFSQFLAIYFELFSSGGIFNSENADEWVPPVRRRCPRRALFFSAPLPRGCHASCRSRTLNALSGPRVGVPTGCPNRLTSPRPVPTAPPPLSEAMPLSVSEARRCSAVSAVARFIHSERRPSPPLAVFHPWSIKLTSPSLLPVAGPPPATVAPPHQKNAAAEPVFSPSPSMRSFGELFSPSPCPAGSLTAVGAQLPPFAPPPPLWHRCWPRHDARPESGDRSGVRRAVTGRIGRALRTRAAPAP